MFLPSAREAVPQLRFLKGYLPSAAKAVSPVLSARFLCPETDGTFDLVSVFEKFLLSGT